MNKELPVAAVDLGGTKILSALITTGGRVLARHLQPTNASKGKDAVLQSIAEGIEKMLAENGLKASQICAVSVAAAGAIDSEKGLVTDSPNLPGWHNVPLRQILAERFGVPAFVVNDASAAALAEHRLGAGRSLKNLIYLTVSTGIGGGIVADGRLYLGSDGSAAELGHMTIEESAGRDNCGNYGCLEMLASGSAIAAEAKKRLKEGRASSLAAMDLDDIDAADVAQAAAGGDELSQQVIARAAHYLGLGLVNIVNIFNPDVIVIGGGVSRIGEPLLEPARRLVAERAFKLPAGRVRILEAELGDDAGVLGAALYAREY
jgi:glucokinase